MTWSSTLSGMRMLWPLRRMTPARPENVRRTHSTVTPRRSATCRVEYTGSICVIASPIRSLTKYHHESRYFASMPLFPADRKPDLRRISAGLGATILWQASFHQSLAGDIIASVIDKPLVTPDTTGTGLGATVALDDDLAPISSLTRMLPDGGAEVAFGSSEDRLQDANFGANLADYLPESTLQSIASDLRFAVEADRQSRRDWEDAITKGMDLLGIKSDDRNEPWRGACGIVHPMILEAAVRFQSKSITRLFPADGPANVKVVGESDELKLQAAKRVATDLNYWLTQKMPEYRDETEQMLFALPVNGSAFKKIFFDPILGRPMAQFVPAADFLMPYGFPNLETCPRYTHVLKKSYADVLRLQESGFYRDIVLNRAPIEINQIEEKTVRLSGVEPSYTQTDLITLWESHVDLAIEDRTRMSPYVVTLEYDSHRILSIYRNWRQGDPQQAKIQSFIHFRYVPWDGPYGLGLIHLIGGIGKGTTSILRQLVDAGTLANLPGGLKSRQLRIKGDDDPIHPGEWRDADVPAGKIADSMFALPYKEPSAVLFQLFQMLVDEGKSFASIAELDMSTSTQNAPVGTMLALIERATEVITAVHSRVHAALGRELALIAEIIRDHTEPEYDYPPANNMPRTAKERDYGQLVSIVPVSDPAASTMAQRVMVYQSALQLSAQAPQLYNLPLLHRSMLEVLGIDNANEIVPNKTDAQPMDPVSENMALLTSKPVRAYEWQDHKSHLGVHMMLAQDPKLQQALQQNPLAPSIMSAGQAHIAEHLAFEYRNQIQQQLGVPLPPLNSKLPPEVENQLSGLLAQAAQKVLAQSKAEQQAQVNQQAQQDPVLQQQKAELQLKAQTAQQKSQTDQGKLRLEAARLQQKSASDAAKLASQERIKQAEIQGENLRHGITQQAESQRALTQAHAENLRHLGDTAVEHTKIAATHAQRVTDAEQAANEAAMEQQTALAQPPEPAEPPA